MPETLIIAPNFAKTTGALIIPCEKINKFIATEIRDTFDFYQNRFGVYSYMQLNRYQKFVLQYAYGVPLMWQAHKSCTFDPLGNVRTGSKEIEPCNAKLNSEFCYDEFFDSCYRMFLNWSGRGPMDLTPDGVKLINKLINILAKNAVLGARMTLTAGKLYDPTKVTFDTATSNEIVEMFTKTAGTCKGWIELLREMGELITTRHCNHKNIVKPEDFDGEKFGGDVLEVYDALFDAAPSALQNVVNEGGAITAVDGANGPIFLVTTAYYNKLAQQYREQCLSVTCLNPRLTRREENWSGLSGVNRPINVYYIDDTPVIPVTDTNQFTKYLTGTTHLAVLTVSRNISLGSSFSALPSLNDNMQDIGMMVERKETVDEYGKYKFLAHALFATSINDTDYVSGTQIYADKA